MTPTETTAAVEAVAEARLRIYRADFARQIAVQAKDLAHPAADLAAAVDYFEAAVRQQVRDEYAPIVAALVAVNDVIELVECEAEDCSDETPCVGRLVRKAVAALRAGEEGGR